MMEFVSSLVSLSLTIKHISKLINLKSFRIILNLYIPIILNLSTRGLEARL